MSIKAGYESFCNLCNKSITLGQLIDKVKHHGWVHTACKPPDVREPQQKPNPTRLERPDYKGLDGRDDAAGKRMMQVAPQTIPTDPDFFNQPDAHDDLDIDRLDFDKLLMGMESPKSKPRTKPDAPCPAPQPSRRPLCGKDYASGERDDD